MTTVEANRKLNNGKLECKDSLPNIGIPESDSKECDYVPKEVLFALTRMPESPKIPEPTKRQPTDLDALVVPGRKRPNNVWHHKRRDKLKHLTDETMCICGAGRDTSFLYDVPNIDRKSEKSIKHDINFIGGKSEKKHPRDVQLPSTLIPEEFHLVKNQGVKHLEFKDEEYKTHLQDHAKHRVQFPSLNPNSRYEVCQLRNTMLDMLEKGGINDLEVEIKGPTQIHNLLELIKKEQDIYNIIFHELIRQVSVDCLERGDLLAEIRKRYSNLLNRVPNQIKCLQQEVIAQRALDRRLTEELLNFKSALNALTSELAKVKEHDSQLAKEVDSTRKSLKNALSEAAKNSNILAEYQELYDLQRRRLEKQVLTQMQEKEMWCSATYDLAMKVIKECNLTTAKRLLISEKVWAKIIQHCAILISDQDTVLLANIQEVVYKWKANMETFYLDIDKWEENSKPLFQKLRTDIESKFEYFNAKIQNISQNSTKIIPTSLKKEIYDAFYDWDEILTSETQNYHGIVSLNRMEELNKILKLQYEWEDWSLMLLDHHTPSDNQEEMLKTNTSHMKEMMIKLKEQYNIILSGDNGAANALLSMSQKLSFWLPKLNSSILGRKELTNNELNQFLKLREEMLLLINTLIKSFGMPDTPEKRSEGLLETRVTIFEVMHAGENWFTFASNVIDSQDAKLIEDANNLHLQIILWICNTLLRFCPDHPTMMQEAKEALYAVCPTPEQLLQEICSIFPKVKNLSDKITRNHSNVTQIAALLGSDRTTPFGSHIKLRELGYEDGSADLDRMHLEKEMARKKRKKEDSMLKMECASEIYSYYKFQNESNKWTETAKLLMSQLLQKPESEIFPNFQQSITNKGEVKKEEQSNQSETECSVLEASPTQENQTVISQDGSMSNITVKKEEEGEEEGEEKKKEAEVEGKSQPKSAAETPEEKATDAALSTIGENATVEEEEGEEDKEDAVEEESSKEGPLSETSEPDENDEQLSEDMESKPANIPDMMEILGDDGNIHVQKLEYGRDYIPGEEANFDIEDLPDIKKAYTALASMRKLQKLLLSAEERAQIFEARAEGAENKLSVCEAKIHILEKQLRHFTGEPEAENLSNVTTTPSTSKTNLDAPKHSPTKHSKKSVVKTIKSKKK